MFCRPFQIDQIKKRAYKSWEKQGERCNNPNSAQYKYYGAKGVKRIWASKECVKFYSNEIEKRDSWKMPVVSRKNDTGNYELGNVELIEQSENAKQVKVTEKKRASSRIRGKHAGVFAHEKRRNPVIFISKTTDMKFEFCSYIEADRYLHLGNGRTRRSVIHKRTIEIEGHEYIAKRV